MQEHNDAYYIDRILNGDKNSFAYLVERHKNMVFTIAKRMLQNQEDAEEVAQDAFMKAYKSLKKFKGESKFSTWLYKIVYNFSISKIRKKKHDTFSIDDSENSHFEAIEESSYNKLQDLEKTDQSNYIKTAIEQLDYEERTVITLYYQKEQKVNEIAEITGLSASNVKVKLFRARKKLYDKLYSLFNNKEKATHDE